MRPPRISVLATRRAPAALLLPLALAGDARRASEPAGPTLADLFFADASLAAAQPRPVSAR